MGFRPSNSRPCEVDFCGVSSWRRCRVCERWVCRDHRKGAGHWFRCLVCPAEAFWEVFRVWRRQEREEKLIAAIGRPDGDPRQLVLWELLRSQEDRDGQQREPGHHQELAPLLRSA